MKAKGNPVPPVSAGFTAEYECRIGYRLIVPLVRPTATVCQADGTWAPPLREACTSKYTKLLILIVLKIFISFRLHILLLQ